MGRNRWRRFNPCFNGSMYKNYNYVGKYNSFNFVSILVLMDLCIKTEFGSGIVPQIVGFNPCFNGSMYKNPLSCGYGLQ